MKHFTIENETNNITIHATARDADALPNSERFSNEGALAKLAGGWPAARLVEIWNSLPGETPVRKFKDRATAVSRIWKAIQSLGESAPAAEEAAPVPEFEGGETAQPEAVIPEVAEPAPASTVAPQSPDVAPAEFAAKKKATRAKKVSGAAKAAKPAEGGPRTTSKTAQLIEMLRRAGGVTLEEMCKKFGWLPHTTRAMMSAGGSLAKKHGITVISEKIGEERRYSIKG